MCFYSHCLFLRFGSGNVLHVASPTAAEECLSKNDVVFANRPHLLSGKYFGYNYTSMPWAPYGDHWQNFLRISAVEILSNTRLDSLADIRLDEIRSMILKFSSTTYIKIMRFYGDLDGEVEEAERFGDLLADAEQVWIDEFRAGGLCGGEEKKKKTLLEILLSLQDADPEYYTDEMIKSLSQALLHGGISTLAETMEWAMTLLLNNNNQHVLHKAQTEIDSFVRCDRLVNEADLSKLPYLQCIIKETLRMHPTTPLLLPHESSKDCVVGGYHIPHGTMLFANV
ncbi:putative isoflavone 2'-hydroxylase [Helianthus debilis subsp. tardiflorus]